MPGTQGRGSLVSSRTSPLPGCQPVSGGSPTAGSCGQADLGAHPSSALTSYVIGGKIWNFSTPQFTHLLNGDSSAGLTELFCS